MKDQAQQPPNPNANPNARGSNTTITQGQAPTPTPSPTPSASFNPSYSPWGSVYGQEAVDNAIAQGGNSSFAQQGFSGVATQPGSTQAAQIAQQAAPPREFSAGGPDHLPPGMMAPRRTDTSGLYGSNITDPGGRTGGNMAPPSQAGSVQAGNLPSGNVPPLVGGADLSGAMKDAQDAAYKNAAGYLDPQWANAQTALENKLANQGVMQNSEAWNKAMDDFGRQKEFAYSQARSGAVAQGNAAHGQLFGEGLAANANQFGQNLQGAQFSNQVREQLVQAGFTQQQIDNLEAQHRFQNSLSARNQGINELLLEQNNPLQMYQALSGGTGVTQPQFTNTPGSNMNPTDILSAIMQGYSGQLNSFNSQTGSANSNNAAMAAIIAALIGG